MPMDMEEQYDKIYRYCFFRLHNQQTAEDITQETFLRYLENYQHGTIGESLKYLYTIARNLCVDEYRNQSKKTLLESKTALENDRAGKSIQVSPDGQLLTSLAVRAAVATLTQDEQELLLLRYVNEVPILTLAQLLGISRFAVYRRLTAVTKKFRAALNKEGLG